jgi:signal transduction histidine kinase
LSITSNELVGFSQIKQHGYISEIKEFVTLLEKNDIHLLVPVFYRDEITAILVLGKRDLNSTIYVTQEIEFLESLALVTGPSLARAELYEKVQDLNENLQSKVEKATEEIRVKNEQLQKTLLRERDMIDIMGHELRTPMTIIRNYHKLLIQFLEELDLNLEKDSRKKKFNKYIQTISENIEREIKLINVLLSATKIGDDRLELNKEPVDIVDVIEDGILGQEHEAKGKGLYLKFKKPGDIKDYPKVHADRVRIQEVVDNLLSNAVKYTDEGGVTIKLSNDGEFAKVEVHDTGIGIPQKDIKNLGKKFYRSKQYTNSGDAQAALVRPGGTGLGLFVTFGLVKAHGGEVEVKSEVGEGSVFSFTVPLYEVDGG